MKVKGAIAVKTRFAGMADVFASFIENNMGEKFTIKELVECTGSDLATSIFFVKNSSDIELIQAGRRGRGGAAIYMVKNSKVVTEDQVVSEAEVEPDVEEVVEDTVDALQEVEI